MEHWTTVIIPECEAEAYRNFLAGRAPIPDKIECDFPDSSLIVLSPYVSEHGGYPTIEAELIVNGQLAAIIHPSKADIAATWEFCDEDIDDIWGTYSCTFAVDGEDEPELMFSTEDCSKYLDERPADYGDGPQVPHFWFD